MNHLHALVRVAAIAIAMVAAGFAAAKDMRFPETGAIAFVLHIADNWAATPDNSGNLITGLFRKADIGRRCNGNEGERNCCHLQNSQPRGKSERHGEGEVSGSVIEGTSEAKETERRQISCRKLARRHSSQRHYDE